MNFALFFSDPRGRLVLLLSGVFLLFAALLIPAYFISMRPTRGTIEWIERLDRPKFHTLRSEALRWGDLSWALLTAFCAAMLRLIAFVLAYLRHEVLHLLPGMMQELSLHYLLPSAVLGVSIYLLLRSMFRLTLPAVCAGLLAGLMQGSNAWIAAITTLSILFLWLWTSADVNAKFLPRALLLGVSLAFYGLAVLRMWALIWLAPLFAAAYIYAQIYRWRNSEKKGRGVRLSISLLLLFFTAVGALLAAWAYYCLYKMRSTELLTDLHLFLELVPEKISGRLQSLFNTDFPMATVFSRDIILFLLGAAAYVTVLHAVIRWHDSKCIALLALVPAFVAVWFLGGLYLCVPMLALAVGWTLGIMTERNHPWLAIGFSAVSAVTYFLEYFI